jgi:hypothetical protein
MNIMSRRARLRAGERKASERLAEASRCKDDPLYFISNFVRVPTNGILRPIVLYELQKTLINQMVAHNQLIVKHPRRAGVSMMAMAYLVWEVLFRADEPRIVLAPNSVMARQAYETFRSLLGSVPSWLASSVASSVNMALVLMNGSVIYFAAANSNLHYTMTPASIYFTDFAFFDSNVANITWIQHVNSINRGSRIFIHSTPNTGVDLFAQLWTKTTFGVPPLHGHAIGYWDLPFASQAKWDANILTNGLYNTKRELGAEIPG